VKHRLQVALEVLGRVHLHAAGPAHQGEGVDREMRVKRKGHAVVLRPQGQVGAHPARFGGDGDGAGIAGGLEHAAQQ
jgi:hypothetical protein